MLLIVNNSELIFGVILTFFFVVINYMLFNKYNVYLILLYLAVANVSSDIVNTTLTNYYFSYGYDSDNTTISINKTKGNPLKL